MGMLKIISVICYFFVIPYITLLAILALLINDAGQIEPLHARPDLLSLDLAEAQFMINN